MIKTVYEIAWTEYEAGWGCRPDGCSLHVDVDSATWLVNKNWLERDTDGPVPDCYSKPDWEPGSGKPPRLVEVDDETYKEVQQKGCVWRF